MLHNPDSRPDRTFQQPIEHLTRATLDQDGPGAQQRNSSRGVFDNGAEEKPDRQKLGDKDINQVPLLNAGLDAI